MKPSQFAITRPWLSDESSNVDCGHPSSTADVCVIGAWYAATQEAEVRHRVDETAGSEQKRVRGARLAWLLLSERATRSGRYCHRCSDADDHALPRFR